jgi:hypothetical protein
MSNDLPTPVITVAKLNQRGACVEEVARFKRCFGDSVVVTVELCVEQAHSFDFAWAIDELLFEGDRDEAEDKANENEDDDYDTALARAFAETYIAVYPKVP